MLRSLNLSSSLPLPLPPCCKGPRAGQPLPGEAPPARPGLLQPGPARDAAAGEQGRVRLAGGQAQGRGGGTPHQGAAMLQPGEQEGDFTTVQYVVPNHQVTVKKASIFAPINLRFLKLPRKGTFSTDFE